MPHRVDLDSIHESVFILINAAFASKKFCIENHIDDGDDEQLLNYDYYFGWLKTLLSERLLSIAIKTRVTMDILAAEERLQKQDGQQTNSNVFTHDRDTVKEYQIGNLAPGTTTLTIREVCNKVIHADDIRPEQASWEERDPTSSRQADDSSDRSYWTGILVLNGTRSGQPWSLELNTLQFCYALEEFIRLLEEKYDWHRIYKYDI